MNSTSYKKMSVVLVFDIKGAGFILNSDIISFSHKEIRTFFRDYDYKCKYKYWKLSMNESSS